MQVTLTGTRPGSGRVVSSIVANTVIVDLNKGQVKIDDGFLSRENGTWKASARLQRRVGRDCKWGWLSIQALSDTVVEVSPITKAKFIEYIATKDGCPLDEARKMDWTTLVESFFDGDEKVALEQAKAWESE